MIYRKPYSQQRETWIERSDNPQESLIYRKLYSQHRERPGSSAVTTLRDICKLPKPIIGNNEPNITYY